MEGSTCQYTRDFQGGAALLQNSYWSRAHSVYFTDWLHVRDAGSIVELLTFYIAMDLVLQFGHRDERIKPADRRSGPRSVFLFGMPTNNMDPYDNTHDKLILTANTVKPQHLFGNIDHKLNDSYCSRESKRVQLTPMYFCNLQRHWAFYLM